MGIFSKIGDLISNGIKKFIKKKDPVKPAEITTYEERLASARGTEVSDITALSQVLFGGLKAGILSVDENGKFRERSLTKPNPNKTETDVYDISLLTEVDLGQIMRNELLLQVFQEKAAGKAVSEIRTSNEPDDSAYADALEKFKEKIKNLKSSANEARQKANEAKGSDSETATEEDAQHAEAALQEAEKEYLDYLTPPILGAEELKVILSQATNSEGTRIYSDEDINNLIVDAISMGAEAHNATPTRINNTQVAIDLDALQDAVENTEEEIFASEVKQIEMAAVSSDAKQIRLFSEGLRGELQRATVDGMEDAESTAAALLRASSLTDFTGATTYYSEQAGNGTTPLEVAIYRMARAGAILSAADAEGIKNVNSQKGVKKADRAKVAKERQELLERVYNAKKSCEKQCPEYLGLFDEMIGYVVEPGKKGGFVAKKLTNEKSVERSKQLRVIYGPICEALDIKELHDRLEISYGVKINERSSEYNKRYKQIQERHEARLKVIRDNFQQRKSKVAEKISGLTLSETQAMTDTVAGFMVMANGSTYVSDPHKFIEEVGKQNAYLSQIMGIKGRVADEAMAEVYKLAARDAIRQLDTHIRQDLNSFYSRRVETLLSENDILAGTTTASKPRTTLIQERNPEEFMRDYVDEADRIANYTAQIVEHQRTIRENQEKAKGTGIGADLANAAILKAESEIERLQRLQIETFDSVVIQERTKQIDNLLTTVKLVKMSATLDKNDKDLKETIESVNKAKHYYNLNDKIAVDTIITEADEHERRTLSEEALFQGFVMVLKRDNPNMEDNASAEQASKQVEAYLKKHPKAKIDDIQTEAAKQFCIANGIKEPTDEDIKTAKTTVLRVIKENMERKVETPDGEIPACGPYTSNKDPRYVELSKRYKTATFVDKDGKTKFYVLNHEGRIAYRNGLQQAQNDLQELMNPKRIKDAEAKAKKTLKENRLEYLQNQRAFVESSLGQLRAMREKASNQKDREKLDNVIRKYNNRRESIIDQAKKFGYEPLYAAKPKLDKSGNPVLDENKEPVFEVDKTQLLGFVDPKNPETTKGLIPVVRRGIFGKKVVVGYRKPAPEVVEQQKPNVEETKELDVTEIELEGGTTFKFEHEKGKAIDKEAIKNAMKEKRVIYKTETTEQLVNGKPVKTTTVNTGVVVEIAQEDTSDLYPVYNADKSEIIGYTHEPTEHSSSTMKDIKNANIREDVREESHDEIFEIEQIELEGGASFGIRKKLGEEISPERKREFVEAREKGRVIYQTVEQKEEGKETQRTVNTDVVVEIAPDNTDALYPVYNADKSEIIGYTHEPIEGSPDIMAVVNVNKKIEELKNQLEGMQRQVNNAGAGDNTSGLDDIAAQIRAQQDELRIAQEKQREQEEQRRAATQGTVNQQNVEKKEENPVNNNNGNGNGSTVVTEEQQGQPQPQPQRQNADSQPLTEQEQLYDHIFAMDDRIIQLSSEDEKTRIDAAKTYYTKQLASNEELSPEARANIETAIKILNNPNKENEARINNYILGAIHHSESSIAESQRELNQTYHVTDPLVYAQGVVAAAERGVKAGRVDGPITDEEKKNVINRSSKSYTDFLIAEREDTRVADELARRRAEIAGLKFPKVTALGAELASKYWAKEISKIEANLAEIREKEALRQKAEQEVQARSNKRIVCKAIAENLTEGIKGLSEIDIKQLEQDVAKDGRTRKVLDTKISEIKVKDKDGNEVPLMDENGVIHKDRVEQYLREQSVDGVHITDEVHIIEAVAQSVAKVGSLEDDGSGLEQLQARTESLEKTDNEGCLTPAIDEKTGKPREVTLQDYILYTHAEGLFDEKTLEAEAEKLAAADAEALTTTGKELSAPEKQQRAKTSVAERTKGMVDTVAQQRKPAEQNTGARQQK